MFFFFCLLSPKIFLLSTVAYMYFYFPHSVYVFFIEQEKTFSIQVAVACLMQASVDLWLKQW